MFKNINRINFLIKINHLFEIITASSMVLISISSYNNKPKKLDYEYMKKLSNEEKRKYIDDYEKSFKNIKKLNE
jgi:hypothetical protein